MNNKLTFRARPVDAMKPMPLYEENELPKLPSYGANVRPVATMPSSMEKEEEMEVHYQQALTAREDIRDKNVISEVSIPVPRISYDLAIDELYDTYFSFSEAYAGSDTSASRIETYADITMVKYDADAEDNQWLLNTGIQYGINVDILEKVTSFSEAQEQVKIDENMLHPLYKYWLYKQCNSSSVPRIRTDQRQNNNAADAYIAFRRRTDKMTTRKHRKNDDLAMCNVLRMIESLKNAGLIISACAEANRNQLELACARMVLFERRFMMKDWFSRYYKTCQLLARPPPAPVSQRRVSVPVDRSSTRRSNTGPSVAKPPVRPNKIDSRKTLLRRAMNLPKNVDAQNEVKTPVKKTQTRTKAVAENPDGRYAFRPKPGCTYHAPILDEIYRNESPYYSENFTSITNSEQVPDSDDSSSEHEFFHAFLHSKNARHPSGLSYAGMVRRRVARSGRMYMDVIPNKNFELPFSYIQDPEEGCSSIERYCPESCSPVNGEDGTAEAVGFPRGESQSLAGQNTVYATDIYDLGYGVSFELKRSSSTYRLYAANNPNLSKAVAFHRRLFRFTVNHWSKFSTVVSFGPQKPPFTFLTSGLARAKKDSCLSTATAGVLTSNQVDEPSVASEKSPQPQLGQIKIEAVQTTVQQDSDPDNATTSGKEAPSSSVKHLELISSKRKKRRMDSDFSAEKKIDVDKAKILMSMLSTNGFAHPMELCAGNGPSSGRTNNKAGQASKSTGTGSKRGQSSNGTESGIRSALRSQRSSNNRGANNFPTSAGINGDNSLRSSSDTDISGKSTIGSVTPLCTLYYPCPKPADGTDGVNPSPGFREADHQYCSSYERNAHKFPNQPVDNCGNSREGYRQTMNTYAREQRAANSPIEVLRVKSIFLFFYT
ncbi:Enhancer of polycomb -like protein 1 [Trichinella murrelli]|uniref:Enhancer of polycomb-like protein 1 n=1 Tax=Trichinella murrelli TaxID=144512 RepID=A0A0V0UKH7_9BILA|nr:Enhancer of polycomb -like protein 1 [Trichinella murrelli]